MGFKLIHICTILQKNMRLQSITLFVELLGRKQLLHAQSLPVMWQKKQKQKVASKTCVLFLNSTVLYLFNERCFCSRIF